MNEGRVTLLRGKSKGENRRSHSNTRGRDSSTQRRSPQPTRYSQNRRTEPHGEFQSLECLCNDNHRNKW